MKYVNHDGGRQDAGFKGTAGDCVCRSIAIVSKRPYAEVYKELAEGNAKQRKGKAGAASGKRSARNGIYTTRKWFKEYMQANGFEWVPTMQVGQGCTTHLSSNELPAGRLVVSVSRHFTAVIDGVIYDTHDPSRDGKRCVYGYWIYKAA